MERSEEIESALGLCGEDAQAILDRCLRKSKASGKPPDGLVIAAIETERRLNGAAA